MNSSDIDASLAVLAALQADPDSPLVAPIDGYTIAELAEILGCSETILRREVQKAFLKIRHNFPELKNELP